jgi:hypothetical protein
MKELTEKETKALKAIAKNALGQMGGKEPKDLHDDNCSWFDRADISKSTGLNKNEAAGLMASLDAKGMIMDFEGDGSGWALTDDGIDKAQEIWNESKIELIAPIGSAPICPKCEHWNAMLDDGYPPDKHFKCRDCGHSVRADQAEVVIWELDTPGMGDQSTYHEINRIPGEKY